MTTRFITIVNKEFVKALIANPSNKILIDVRELNEVLDGVIPTAKHISVQSLEKALLLPLDEFESTYGFRKPGVEDPLVFYCRSGKRSGLAASIAEKLGYKEIYDYSGSWIDWNQ